MRRYIVGLVRRAYQTYLRHGLLYVVLAGVKFPFSRISRRMRGKLPSKAPAETQGTSFDGRFNVDTSRTLLDDVEGLAAVSSPNWKHGFYYSPSDERVFKALMASLVIRHEDFVFVDVGSGKGKVLLMAAEYPFKRVVGIEYSKYLHEAAQRNIAAYRSPDARCAAIESICGDAASTSLPCDPMVLYMFNPFGVAVLEPMVKNLVRSLAEIPRKVFVVYYNALCGDIFLKYGFREIERVSAPPLVHAIFEWP